MQRLLTTVLTAGLAATSLGVGVYAPVARQAKTDSVSITRATLARALDNATMCGTGGARGGWAQAASFLEVGDALVLADGKFAGIDRDAGSVRVFDTAGREIARHGKRGQGPGEFGVRALLVRWGGDTIAVFDPATARFSLFHDAGLVSTIQAAELVRQVRSGLTSRLADGRLVFTTTQGPTPSGAQYRMAYRLVGWKPGTAATEVSTIKDTVLGPETVVIPMAGRSVFGRANLGRTTSFAGVGDIVALYDDAAPRIEILDVARATRRVVLLEVTDPPTSSADRDSVLARVERQPLPQATPEMLEVIRRFPSTRPAATWGGLDADGGVWIAFHPPLSAAGVVHVRLTARGAPDRCVRTAPSERVVAFGRNRVVLATTTDSADVVRVVVPPEFPQR